MCSFDFVLDAQCSRGRVSLCLLKRAHREICLARGPNPASRPWAGPTLAKDRMHRPSRVCEQSQQPQQARAPLSPCLWAMCARASCYPTNHQLLSPTLLSGTHCGSLESAVVGIFALRYRQLLQSGVCVWVFAWRAGHHTFTSKPLSRTSPHVAPRDE